MTDDSSFGALLVEAMQDDDAGRRDMHVPVALIRRRSCGCEGR